MWGVHVGEWVKDDYNTHIHPIYPTPSPTESDHIECIRPLQY
jgi:hypothetical protein